MSCNEIRRRTTTQQPTNERRHGGSGSATVQGQRQLGDGAAAAAARRQQRGSYGGGGSAKADVGGSLAATRRWRQRNSALFKIFPVGTSDQITDVLTKALAQNDFTRHRIQLCGK